MKGKLLQVWRYGGNHASERNLDDAIETASTFGFDGLLVKVLDGTSWMKQVAEPEPEAPGSPEEVATQRDRCHAAGLTYYTWTNPLHDGDLDRQAALTADAALASDGLFLDVEPYAGPPPFWGANRPVGLARGFLENVRARAPGAWLAIQPDPRAAHLTEIRLDEWLPLVDAFSGQHYWSDFVTDRDQWPARARQELQRATDLGQQLGKPSFPTIPGNASVASMPTDLLGTFSGLVVWRMGSLKPEMLAFLRGLTLVTPPQNEPRAPQNDLASRVSSLTQGLAHVADVLVPELANPNTSNDRRAALAAEVKRIREQFIGPTP